MRIESLRSKLNYLGKIGPDMAGLQAMRQTAEYLLTGVHVKAFGQSIRLLEIEFYLRSESHPDPFTHCHPIQKQLGCWYLHRVGNGYRGGSFKGLDLTFGNRDYHGGVLIRSIQAGEKVVSGPSKSVDHLLRLANLDQVRDLDDRIGEISALDETNPVHLVTTELKEETVYSSARVGLAFRGLDAPETGEAYFLRRYRFLREPRAIKKGRVQLILALLSDGLDTEQVHRVTGSPRHVIRRYAELAATADGQVSDYHRVAIGTKELCTLAGIFGDRS